MTTTSTPGTASTSARALARDHLTRAILASARAQLGTVGPAALSVRAVARDVGLASSAVYRYFASRDDLLTALLVACFDEHGEVVEAAAARRRPGATSRAAGPPSPTRSGRWALAHPWDYALLYGSPVPGYEAPVQTVGPATRVTRVLMGLLADAAAAGVPLARPGETGPGRRSTPRWPTCGLRGGRPPGRRRARRAGRLVRPGRRGDPRALRAPGQRGRRPGGLVRRAHAGGWTPSPMRPWRWVGSPPCRCPRSSCSCAVGWATNGCSSPG